jgi:ribosomal protein L24
MFGSFLETCLFINKVEIVKETKEMQNSPQKKRKKKSVQKKSWIIKKAKLLCE